MGLQPQKCIRGGRRGLAVNTSYVTPRPLDLFPGAALALGLRAESAATLTSPIIKVRRTSDNAQANIYADLSVPWADITLNSPIVVTSGSSSSVTLGDFCAGTNGAIVTWYDQSGLARHATQGTTGAQPLLVQNGQLVTRNGRPALLFDGVDDFLGGSLIPSLVDVPTSVFMFFAPASTSVDHRALFYNNGAIPGIERLKVNIQGGLLAVGLRNVANTSWIAGRGTSGITAGNSYLMASEYDGTARNLFLDGVDNSSPTGTLGQVGGDSNTMRIGARSSSADFFHGRLSELIISADTPLPNRAAITAAQARYFGITLP